VLAARCRACWCVRVCACARVLLWQFRVVCMLVRFTPAHVNPFMGVAIVSLLSQARPRGALFWGMMSTCPY
jgi:hypothetical protein